MTRLPAASAYASYSTPARRSNSTMKLKMKHLRHPLRTAVTAKGLATIYLDMKRFGDRSKRHFRNDDRYELESVSRGFASRFADESGDEALLERICTSYNKAIHQEHRVAKTFQASDWWQQVRHGSLRPVIQALRARDIDALGRMYRNFFRDSCAAGLIGLPYGMSKAYFGGAISNIHRRYYLGDALFGLDYWTMQTEHRFPLRDLAGPEIGNPFGVMIEDMLVRTGAAYQHYSAQRVRSGLGSEAGVVAEIGGGFGGMAYYLLRDQVGVKYLDFDVPESIALASYYLLKSFPHLNFLLYGEKEFAWTEMDRVDVALMPVFELEKMPPRSVDVTFSSHSMSDMSYDPMSAYLEIIARITKTQFLYIGNSSGAESISNLTTERHRSFRLAETKPSGWHDHKYPRENQTECLYRLGSH